MTLRYLYQLRRACAIEYTDAHVRQLQYLGELTAVAR
jgi:hypothetical protein